MDSYWNVVDYECSCDLIIDIMAPSWLLIMYYYYTLMIVEPDYPHSQFFSTATMTYNRLLNKTRPREYVCIIISDA